MKKGFTLVELLAVIVILAIIAMIAVPIVFNIISTSRTESRKRSVDMYARALETSVLNYRVANGKKITGTFTTNSDGHILTNISTGETLNVEFNGSNVFCNTIDIYEDQTIYLDECKVGDSIANAVDVENYTYGGKQIFEYMYRYTSTEYEIGDIIDISEIKSNYNNMSHQFFLRHELDKDGYILSTDVCFVLNDKLNCLPPDFYSSMSIFSTVFPECNNTSCSWDTYTASVDYSGNVRVGGSHGECSVSSTGTSSCH